MTLYEHKDYRQALKWASQRWKGNGPGRTYLRLAKAAGVHPPYFTNVLKEKAHLNGDQLYSVMQYMGHSNSEMEYMLLLMEQEKCYLQTRKAALREQLNRLKAQEKKTENSIDVEVIAPTDNKLSRYYLDPTIRLVYAFMAVPELATDPLRIARSLNFSEQTVQETITYLLDVGLIEKNDQGQLVTAKTKIHLPRESHLFEAQRKLLLYRCLEHQDRTRNESDYNFEVTFSATKEVKEIIHQKFLDLLKEVQPLVEKAEPEEVFQMNFELFNWSE